VEIVLRGLVALGSAYPELAVLDEDIELFTFEARHGQRDP
jgi:hypothetical protein